MLRSSGIDHRDVDRIAAEVATAVKLAEGPSGVTDVIRAVLRHEPIPARDISRHAELPVPLVTAICNELRKRGVVDTSRPVRLTQDGRDAFAGEEWQNEGTCPTCDGRGIVVPSELDSLSARMTHVTQSGPEAKVELDQTHCTIDTKLRRVMLMSEHGLLSKRILFLGDDDLTSIAVAHACALSGADTAITVIDVDDDVLSFIKDQAHDIGVPIEIIKHDLKQPLPETLREQFDVVFTDPPYTVAGARLFLSRAVTALAPVAGKHILFAFGARRPSQTVQVQQLIAQMGLAVRSLSPNFNEYVGAGILGGTSHMYHLRTADTVTPAVTGDHEGDLYTSDGRAASKRTYQCVACKHTELVGPGGKYSRIADLKAVGCVECGSTKFRPLSLNR